MRHAVMKSHSFQRELSNPFPHISETNLLYLPHTDFLSDGAHLAAPDQTQALPPERRLSPSARHRWDDPWYRGTCVEATNPPKKQIKLLSYDQNYHPLSSCCFSYVSSVLLVGILVYSSRLLFVSFDGSSS